MSRRFRDGADPRILARHSRIGISTAYRYLHEGIDVLAAAAPDLHEVLDQTRRENWSHVMLDGTLIETDRVDAGGTGLHARHRRCQGTRSASVIFGGGSRDTDTGGQGLRGRRDRCDRLRSKGRHLAPDNACHNSLQIAIRELGERANALIKTRWTVLDPITLCPTESAISSRPPSSFQRG